MFANRRATGVPVRTQPLTAVQFERKPNKPLIQTTQPKQVLQTKPKLIIKKDSIPPNSPMKPASVFKPS